MVSSARRVQLVVVSFVLLGSCLAATAARLADSDREGIALLRDEARRQGRIRLLVELDDAISTLRAPAAATNLADDVHLATLHRFDAASMLLADVDLAGLERLASDSHVVGLWQDTLLHASLDQSTRVIDAPRAWAAGFTGRGTQIAILDTGVAASHPFFEGRVVDEACFSSTWDALHLRTACPNGQASMIGPSAARPCNGFGCEHGTHVAGIAAGHSNRLSGVAPDAEIVAVQVFSLRYDSDACGGSDHTPCAVALMSDILKGLDYVAGQRLKSKPIAVVNLSLGEIQGNYCDSGGPLLRVFQRLVRTGVVPVVAAANGYNDGCRTYPACLPQVVSVARTGYANDGVCVDIAAPGTDILSSVPPDRFARISGSSTAAAHISGAIAVVRAANPGLDALDAVATLRAGADEALVPSVAVGAMPDRIHVANLDFDLGPNQGWKEQGGNHPLVDGPQQTQDLPVTPRSGSWMAHLGGLSGTFSSVSLPVYFPPGGEWAVRYSRQFRSGAPPGCRADFKAQVSWRDDRSGPQTEILDQEPQVCSDKTSLDWKDQFSFFLNPSGRLAQLTFFESAYGEDSPARIFVDDVSLSRSAAPEGASPPVPPSSSSYFFEITGGAVSRGEIAYEVDWDDGTRSLATVGASYFHFATHTWQRPGRYEVRARVHTAKGILSAWSGAAVVNISNPSPYLPDIKGRFGRRSLSCFSDRCSVSARFKVSATNQFSGPFELRAYIADGRQTDSRRSLVASTVVDLTRPYPDPTREQVWQFSFRTGLPGAKGHYLVVVIDEADHVVEIDETNNEVAVFLGR